MYLSDLHTHSIASGHGTDCTILTMAKEASARGLKLLGISDHGPATPGAGTESYFRSLTYTPKKRCGIDILYGAECNILSQEGKLDLDDSLLELLDYGIASFHVQNFRPSSIKENTQAMISAFRHPGIKIAGHCDDVRYPLDIDTVVAHAGQYHVIMEVNEASLMPGSSRGDTRENCRRILSACKRFCVPVILSSDSHGAEHIGDFPLAAAFVHGQGFPEDLILNNRINELKAFLAAR